MSDTHVVSQNRPDPQEDFSVNRLIGTSLLIRIVVDSGIQLFFPFLPVIAQGLRVSEVRLGRLLSLRAVMGMIAPAFGTLGDRYGYRLVLTALASIGSAGLLTIGLSNSFGMAAVGMGLAGLGLMSFPPTLAAYLSAQLPFERRSRGLGIVEYAWALAGIVGLSLLGQLIGITSWRAPFFVLSGLLVIAAIRIWFLPPTATDREAAQNRAQTQERQSVSSFFDLGPNWRSAVAVMANGFLIMIGGMTLLINYGSWFAQEYGLEAAQLGQLAFVLGFADIIGSGIVSIIGDRLGKRNTVVGASLIGVVAFILLPIFNTSYTMALVGAFFARFAFETAIVGNIVLSSEQAPEQRGKVMTLSASSVTMSVAVASTTGPLVFAQWGVAGIGAVGAIALALGAIVTMLFAKESG